MNSGWLPTVIKSITIQLYNFIINIYIIKSTNDKNLSLVSPIPVLGGGRGETGS